MTSILMKGTARSCSRRTATTTGRQRRRVSSSDAPPTGRLILVRHGQSVWNVTDASQGTTARFTGWADVGLTERGVGQARAAGRALRSNLRNDGETLRIDAAFCSLLSRAKDTLYLTLRELGLVVVRPTHTHDTVVGEERGAAYRIPVVQSWRLNERHYGDLVGFSKAGAERHYGKEKLEIWRNSWSIAPPAMSEKRRLQWKEYPHCRTITKVKVPYQTRGREYDILETGRTGRIVLHGNDHDDDDNTDRLPAMPGSESMYDTCLRILPLWTEAVAPRLRNGENVLVAAHANTIRALLHCIDPTRVTRTGLKKVRVASAKPLVYTLRRASAHDARSRVVPGNLVLLNREGGELMTDHAWTPHDNDNNNDEPKINGYWIEDEEIQDLSFCSDLGQNMGEQDIA